MPKTEHFNKGKKYNKDEHKKNIVKYFKIDKPTLEKLLKHCEETGFTQSAIIKKAIVSYLKNIK